MSNDGTIKFLFKLPDGKSVKGFDIDNQRITACVSSQADVVFLVNSKVTGK